MNGYSSRTTPPYGFNAGVPTPASSLNSSPAGKRLAEGYRKDIMNAFESDKPRFNPVRPPPMNTGRIQSSPLVDLQDPIQVHLLTETALFDSKQYEILSQEEVDDLKKQCRNLSQRIEGVRHNLTIETKLRDAAISMTRLYSPPRPEGRRRSILGRSLVGDPNAKEAEASRIESERKCEEMATELFNLEKRIMEPRRRLLEHTAGILQLTHKGSAKKKANEHGLTLNGMPGSPESLYTYAADRDADFIDDVGSRLRGNTTNTIEIPMRSPIREQTRELREEGERLREENRQLQMEVEALRQESAQGSQLPPGSEERLQDLSELVRRAVVAADPAKYGNFGYPPNGPLGSYLDYLEAGMGALRIAQDFKSAETSGREEESSAAIGRAAAQADDITGQLRRLMTVINPDYPLPRSGDPQELDGKLTYLEDILRLIQGEAIKAIDGAKLMAADSQYSADVDDLLRGLWDSIQNSLTEAKRRREQRRAAGQLDDDVSGDEMMDTEEEYSLPAFASKVRYITSKASDLREQKTVLHRQIRQQRELNSKLSADGEADLMKMQDELDQVRRQLEQSQNDAADAQVKLSDALRNAESVQSARAIGETTAVQEAEARLAERNAAVTQLESSRRELQDKLARLEPTIEELTAKLSKAEANAASLDGRLADTVEAKRFIEGELEARQQEFDAKMEEFSKKDKELQDKDKELEELNVMFIEVKTELTFAQAELDGAYGSRAERAKEAAAVKNNASVSRLESQVNELKTQLAGTVDELQQMTKETLGAEREKMELETKLDDALALRDTLENETKELRGKLDQELESSRAAISKLQEELDTEKLKMVSSAASTGGGRGATMLSEQFRATMREERKKFQEDMKEEQSKRRKIEDELSKLRREMALRK